MKPSEPDTPPRAARILIVDDHPMVREGLVARISTQSDLHVCGEAGNVGEALRLVEQLHPDLAIIDISLKDGHGLDLIKQIRLRDERIKMLVSSMHDETLFAERALRAGAMGYINKQEAPEQVIDAIRQVLDGKMVFSTRMTERILHRAVGRSTQGRQSPIEGLTDRELEVFELIGHGMTTRKIANQLGLSVHTIETHREKIKSKLKLKNSAELGRHALQWVLESG
jgi:DNA-binding NarL/FixJ family response regulator